MKVLTTRKTIIKEFAEELARIQREADIWYYLKNDKNHSDWLLVKADEIKNFAIRLNICKEVYNEAYKIYDFRNSGRKGYTLKSGIIVKVGETNAE